MAYPVSERFIWAVNQGGEVVVEIEVWESGKLIETPEFSVRDGSVTADSTSTNWRRGDATFADETGSLIPASARDLFSPVSGREFVPKRGFRYPDGTTELVPMGHLKITDCNVAEDHEGVVVKLSGVDRSQFFQDNEWTEPFTVFGPADYAFAIFAIFSDRAPAWMLDLDMFEVGFVAAGFPFTVPFSYNPHDDPWAAMASVAKSIGFEIGFNATGQVRIRPAPSPAATGVGISRYYTDGWITRRIEADYSSQSAYNGVVAVGQNTFGLTPPRAVVWDDNPASATYYLGPGGKKPFFRDPDPRIVSIEQCQAAARGDLNSKLGVSQSVNVDVMCDPSLDLGDYALVASSRSKLDDVTFLVDSITTPLRADRSQQVRMRERRLVV